MQNNSVRLCVQRPAAYTPATGIVNGTIAGTGVSTLTCINIHVHDGIHIMRHNELQVETIQLKMLLHQLQAARQGLLQQCALILTASQRRRSKCFLCIAVVHSLSILHARSGSLILDT